jgi:hypothetical protein
MTSNLLLHLVSGNAAGIWRQSGDAVTSSYFSGANKEEERAQQFLNSRGSAVSWEDWFSVMAAHSPYTDQYVLVPDSGTPLLQQLQQLRMSVTLGESI